MARTVVAAATFASVGQDKAILSVIDRLAPAQQQEVKTEMALALARRVEGSGKLQGAAGSAKNVTITIPGSGVETTSKVYSTQAEAEEVFLRIILNVDPKATYNAADNTFTAPPAGQETPGKTVPTQSAVQTLNDKLFTPSGGINSAAVLTEIKTNFKSIPAVKSFDENRQEINLYASP
jgi:hypothetical protein